VRGEASSSESPRYDKPIRRKGRDSGLYRRRRIGFGVGVVFLCIVVVAAVLAITAGGSSAQVATTGVQVGPSASATVTADRGTHPAFARLRDRNLLLPVNAEAATIIAYQPIADSQAIQFSPVGEQANSNRLVRFFRGIFSGEPSVRYFLLPGDGSGSTGSILVGAAVGSPITAPVSGTVTAVKQYSLFGKYDDVQVDIRPEEMSGVTFTMLLVADPVVSMGEVVTAGKTAIGKVRECPDELGKQLSAYTHDCGSHVIIQATEEPIS
jgi:hypothetical protein